MNNFGEIVGLVWSVADLLRDPYKPAQYGDVSLPMTVRRRLDCVIEKHHSIVDAVGRHGSRLDAASAGPEKAIERISEYHHAPISAAFTERVDVRGEAA